MDNRSGNLLKNFKRESCRRCRPRIYAVPAAYFYLLTEITLAVPHTGHAVFVKDRHVLKCTAAVEQTLDNGGRLADNLDTFRCCLPYDSSRECRARERNTFEQLGWKPEGFADFSDTILAKLYERLDNTVAESFLRVDPELLEDIVLPLDPRDCFIDIGQDCSL